MTKRQQLSADQTLDCKGLACPMPIVRTKKMMEGMAGGRVLEIQATDKGSQADLQAWARNAGHQYLGTIAQEDMLRHFVRKSSAGEEVALARHPHTVSNEELQAIVEAKSGGLLLDVREPAEYAFAHIPGAVSVPLGVLEDTLDEWERQAAVYVICRTGSRSDLACQLLAERGFEKVYNVLPGMSQWDGLMEREV